MTMTEDIARVLALSELATPGEWRMYGGTNHGRVQTDDVWVCDGSPPHFMQPEDAKLIAAAVNAWRTHGPEILALAERLAVAEADAARYRWAVSYGTESGDTSELDDAAWGALTGPYVKEYIDAAIDTARAGEKG